MPTTSATTITMCVTKSEVRVCHQRLECYYENATTIRRDLCATTMGKSTTMWMKNLLVHVPAVFEARTWDFLTHIFIIVVRVLVTEISNDFVALPIFFTLSCSCLTVPCSCLTVPCSCLTVPCSCLTVPCSCLIVPHLLLILLLVIS